MGRAVFGLLLGFAIVFSVALWARTCLPDPHDKGIEWLHREDVVVVQMKTVGGDVGDPYRGLTDPFRAPRLTLYGDGTLIVPKNADSCAVTTGVCEVLVKDKLSVKEVRDLLSFIDDAGFFDFNYKQPQPSVNGAPTTYIFASDKSTQNAVSANALHFREVPNDKEWRQYRKLGEIHDRLQSLAENTLTKSTAYSPTKGELDIIPVQASGGPVGLEWPFAQFDISAAAAGQTSGKISVAQAELVGLGLDDAGASTCWCPVHVRNRAFYVFYRSLLPYEENFPEFEAPPQ